MSNIRHTSWLVTLFLVLSPLEFSGAQPPFDRSVHDDIETIQIEAVGERYSPRQSVTPEGRTAAHLELRDFGHLAAWQGPSAGKLAVEHHLPRAKHDELLADL